MGVASRKKKKTKGTVKLRKREHHCHPRIKNMPDTGCLPVEVLEKARKAFNRESKVSKKNVLEELAEHLDVDPNNQNSLLKALPLPDEEKRHLAKKWLRPEMPASWKEDPRMWLDSNNIRDVMKQYEDSHPRFKFLGPYPIDFGAKDPTGADKCLIPEMCEMDLDGNDLEGIDFIGTVYNLDPHYKGGSHWMASFINIPKKEFYYFDSYGIRPPNQIYRFMQWLTIQEPDMKLMSNGVRFQRRESECGMYCMYFIVCMLEGESFRHFCKRSLSDSFMIEMRKRMYST